MSFGAPSEQIPMKKFGPEIHNPLQLELMQKMVKKLNDDTAPDWILKYSQAVRQITNDNVEIRAILEEYRPEDKELFQANIKKAAALMIPLLEGIAGKMDEEEDKNEDIEEAA
ncbi:MAG: hypothetical protein WCF94_03385 [bacterium]